MNPIQHLICMEIEVLLQKSKGFEAVEHNSTKGGLRENLLIDFFKKLIPKGLSITGGIICDSKGQNSNQTDFIIYNKSMLPRVLLDKNIAIIPIETVYLIAEIKTTLTTSDLDQIKKANENFRKLRLAINSKSSSLEFRVPNVIIAYNTNVAETTLLQWMNQMDDIVSICVIGKFTLSKENSGIETYKQKTEKPKYFETLVFYNQLYGNLRQTLEERKVDPIWEAYLFGMKQ